MTPTKGITFAGEYVLKEFSILKSNSELAFDVRNQLQMFMLYEDMFSPFISGTAVLRDTQDLLNLYGRGGKNLIRIVVGTPGLESSDVVGHFHLYKIADRSLPAERTQVYTLNFISEEQILDQNTIISKNFSGAPDAVFKELFEKQLKSTKKLTADPVSNKVEYVSNYWSAIDNMSYLCDHATSASGAADFIFFENRNGFNFRSTSILNTQPVSQYFNQSNFTMASRSPDGSSVIRDINLEFQQIQSLKTPVIYDFMRDHERGGVFNRMLLADPIRKSYKVQDESLDKSTRRLLNNNKNYRDIDVLNTRPKIITSIRQFGTHIKQDLSNASFLSKRIMESALTRALAIEVEVLGRMDYTVGMKVNLELNQIREILADESKDQYLDRILSGDYLIGAIAHKFNGKSHTCNMELIKDSTIST